MAYMGDSHLPATAWTGRCDDPRDHQYETVADAKYHLNREQRLMDDYEFPDRQGRKAQHQGCIDAVARFEEQYQYDLKVNSLQGCDFLRGWLLRHISYADKDLGAFIGERRAAEQG